MDTGIGDETLLISNVKECAVGDAGLICHSTRVSSPSIKMGIKMNYRDRPIDFIERTKDRENNCVVTAKTRPAMFEDKKKGTQLTLPDDSWMLATIFCQNSTTGPDGDVCCERTRKQGSIRDLHLVYRKGIVKRYGRDLDTESIRNIPPSSANIRLRNQELSNPTHRGYSPMPGCSLEMLSGVCYLNEWRGAQSVLLGGNLYLCQMGSLE